MSSNKKETTRKTRSVYFSLLEPFDVELLKHAEQINPLTGKKRNFSRYVRRLIEDDMRREKQGLSGNNDIGGFAIPQNQSIDEDDEYTLEVKSDMQSFI